MKRLVSLVAMLAALGVVGWGYTINLLTVGQPYTLYNTGVDNSGLALSGTVVDPHYTDNNWAGSNATFTSRNDAWRSDITTGLYNANDGPNNPVRWITPGSGGGGQAVDAGTIYFYTNFTLPTTYPLWNVVMSVLVWADNTPTRISLMDGSTELASTVPPTPSNSGECGYVGPGSSTGACSGGAAYSGGPNSLSYNGLIGGQTYSIRFEVINQGSSGNPAGLWVQWQSASAEGVPEPGTYALMGTVGLALYLLRRRKTAAKS
jgi:hypothetical protein